MKTSIKNIIKNNKFFYSHLLYFKYLLLKNKSAKKRKANIFMIHIGRVGSTVLADLLNQHSKIHWDGEFYPKNKIKFLKFIYKNPLKILKIRMHQYVVEFYGFEIKSLKKQLYAKQQEINMPIEKFINNIEDLNFNHFILLERINYLKQFISFKFAKKTKIHHTKQETKKLNTIHINVESCLWFNEKKTLTQHFEYLDNFYEKTKKIIKNKKHLLLTYEDHILKNPTVAYRETCDFLKIENLNPQVNLKRTNPFPLKEVIENYTEVENYLKGTKYEWMLYQ